MRLIVLRLAASTMYHFNGKHVMITGGSSGIGKAIAMEMAHRGASITLMARNQARLDDAMDEVKRNFGKDHPSQKISTVSADVSGDYKQLEEAVKKAEEELGPVDVLVNSAGISVAHRLEDTPMEDFKRVMDINMVGSAQMSRAVVPQMKKRETGRIVFLSSLAGVCGVYGYTAYCASKFAIRGFAEALFMEVKPYNIKVVVSYPPDVDTPMLVGEQETRPPETELIAGSIKLQKPEDVAKTIVNDIAKGTFMNSQGLDGWMLTTACAGMSPASSKLQGFVQICCMGVLRLAALIYLYTFDSIVAKCKKQRDSGQIPDKKQQ